MGKYILSCRLRKCELCEHFLDEKEEGLLDIHQMDFITIFLWLYNIGAASITLFLIIQILLMSRKVQSEVIRARLFLNTDLLNDTWKYISIAGASFAINALVGFVKFNMNIQTYYLWEITEVIFFAAFVIMIYQWYQFMSGLIVRKK
jgi:hypothetical protein